MQLFNPLKMKPAFVNFCALLMGISCCINSQTTVLHNFISEDLQMNYNNVSTDGEFVYGTKCDGGDYGKGFIYKIRIDNSGYEILLNFDETNTGSYPARSLLVAGNTLFGVTWWGGLYDKGTIYRINTDGSGFQKLFDFSEGNIPQSLIILDGVFYGALESGGSYGKGMLFKLGIDGKGYENLHSFSSSDGWSPSSPLLSDGNTLFGTTSRGGTYDIGVVYKINTNGNDFSVLHEFAGSDGNLPVGAMVLINKSIYGTTSQGGSQAKGIFYKINTDGSGFQVLGDFAELVGINPEGLTEHDHMLYGMTNYRVNGPGTVFKVDTTGINFTTLASFDNSSKAYPMGTLASYGTTLFGNASGGTYNYGVVFSVDMDGSNFHNIRDFTATNDGYNPRGAMVVTSEKCYGFTKGGGIYNKGVIYAMNNDGTGYQVIHNFNDDDGAYPTGSLVLKNNILYGMTSQGGTSGCGVFFRFDLGENNYQKLFDFSYNIGDFPTGFCLSGSEIYGMTGGGGANNDGVIFKMNIDGTGFTTLFNFTGTHIFQPAGSPVVSESVFYGMARNNSAEGKNIIFSIRTDGTGFRDVYAPNDADAGDWDQTLLCDGDYLYELIANGGTNNVGALLKIKTDGSTIEKLWNFSFETGAVPQDPLILSGSWLYGTTSMAGPNQTGGVFRIKTDGTGYENLLDFKSCFELIPEKSINGLNQVRMLSVSGELGSGVSSTEGAITLYNNSLYIVAAEKGGSNNQTKIFKYKMLPSFEDPSPASLSFGNVRTATNSTPQSYTLTGSNLTGNVTITAPTGFLISGSSGGIYGTTLNLTPIEGNINSTIYVRFSPTLTESYSGTITNTSAGVTTINVSVSGTGVTPTLNTPTLTSLSFGDVQINSNSIPQSYTLTGSNLTGNVTITAPTGFQVSNSETGTYLTTLILVPTSGSLNVTLYVRFTPVEAQAYNGNVTNSCFGVDTVNLLVSGTGVNQNECPPIAKPDNFVASQGTYCDFVHTAWDSVIGAESYLIYKDNSLLTCISGLSYDDYTGTTSPGIYKIFAKNSCDISVPDSSQGYTALLPIVNLGNDLIIQSDSLVILDAGEGFISYNWSSGETGQILSLDHLQSGIYTYSLIATNQFGCSASDTIKITVSIPTSIPVSDAEIKYKIYPNPSTGDIYLYLTTEETIKEFTISILSITGNLVDRLNLKTSEDHVYKLNFDHSPGIYQLIISIDKHIIKDKLIFR